MSCHRRIALVAVASLLSACPGPTPADDTGGSSGTTATPGTTGTAADTTTTDPPDETTTTSPTTTTTPTTGEPATTSTDPTTSAGETCDSECAPIPCTSEGGKYCGGNGVGGDPTILYVCQDGALQVLEQCGEMCSYMPAGIPDQCPSGIVDVPASLLDLLDDLPYVEQDCVPTTHEGWPYDAQECTYITQGVTAMVKIANPPADRVGAWIVDAATYIPALAELADIDAGAYEAGLHAIGLHMLYQSSRIFPLTGDIIEDLGNGPEKFPFNDGVSDPCGSGCYCRINSLHRTEWCAYQETLGTPYDACIGLLGDSGHTAEWAGHCLQNHITAWTSNTNDHFRAKAYLANEAVSAACPPGTCSPAQVVNAVEDAYGL